jgi:hypothetical protein
MRIELDGLWELVEDDVGDSFSALLEGFLRPLEEFKVTLHGTYYHLAVSFHWDALTSASTESGTSQSITSLGNGLDSHIQNIEYTIQREQGEFLAAVKYV